MSFQMSAWVLPQLRHLTRLTRTRLAPDPSSSQRS